MASLKLRPAMAAAVIVICHLIVFGPLLQAYPHTVVLSEYPDVLEFVWTAWRLDKVVEGTEFLYSTHLVFAPEGASLLLHTVCEGILFPVALLFGAGSPELKVSGAFLFLSILNTLSARSLFRACGASSFHSLLLSIMAGCGPFLSGHLHAGHLNFMVMFPLFEILRGILTQLHSPKKEWYQVRVATLRVCLAAGLLPWTNLYYTYFVALLIPVLAVLFALLSYGSSFKKNYSYLEALWKVGCFTALSWLPSLPHLLSVMEIASTKSFTPDHTPQKHAADLAFYIVPNSLQLFGSRYFGFVEYSSVHPGESSLFLSYGLLLFLCVALCIQRRSLKSAPLPFVMIAAAGFFLLLSTGPVVTVLGNQIFLNPSDTILRALLPMYPSVPVRFGGLVMPLLLCAAASVSMQMVSRSQRLLACFLLLLATFEVFPSATKVVEMNPHHEIMEAIREDKEIKIVLDTSPTPQRGMYHQIYHTKPIVGGFLSRRPKAVVKKLSRNNFLRWIHSRDTYSVDAILNGWCDLKSDALIFSKAVLSKDRLATLQQLHFHPLMEDSDYIALKRTNALCTRFE